MLKISTPPDYYHTEHTIQCAGCGATLTIPAGTPFAHFAVIRRAMWAGSPLAGVPGWYCDPCLESHYDTIESLGYHTRRDSVLGRIMGTEEHTQYQIDYLAAGGMYKLLWRIGADYTSAELYH